MKDLLLPVLLVKLLPQEANPVASGWSQWQFGPEAILLVILFGGIYFFLARGKWHKGLGLYGAGLFIVLLVQAAPMHYLASHHLFSAHMAGHIIILLLCAPLMVLGLPKTVGSKAPKVLTTVSGIMAKWPWLGWLSGVGIMWFWHIPAVFNAVFAAHHAAGFSFLPIIHTVSLLLAGMLFAWSLIGPHPQHQINPLAGVVYLFTACISCSLLGLLITFAPPGIYHHSLHAVGQVGHFRQNGGSFLVEDQQMAGLIMWVPCCFIYLSGSLYLLRSWLTAKPGQQWQPNSLTLK